MSKTGDIEAFIIHLARATARRPQVERLLEDCPVPARVLDAVDGRAMSEAEIDAVYSRTSLHVPHYPFEMTVGEIGCFLSHRKAWQAIVDSGLDAGLVIEDDVEMDPAEFGGALEMAAEHVGELGYIQFQTRPLPDDAEVVGSRDRTKLVRPLVAPLRTSAQLVSSAHAKHLLEITPRIDRPVDGLLQMSWVTSKRLCCAVPSGVIDRTQEAGGSTISVQRPKYRVSVLYRNILREIWRFRYRRDIRAYSRAQARLQGVAT
jgi:glycosyl transferase family 25